MPESRQIITITGMGIILCIFTTEVCQELNEQTLIITCGATTENAQKFLIKFNIYGIYGNLKRKSVVLDREGP